MDIGCLSCYEFLLSKDKPTVCPSCGSSRLMDFSQDKDEAELEARLLQILDAQS